MLTRLETLRLAKNQLQSLPDTLSCLTNLKCLDIRRNTLVELPPALGNCAKLEELDASGNAIAEIPLEFSTLKNLQILLLAENRIKKVDSEIFTGCLSLATLTLHDNPITKDQLHETKGFDEFERRRKDKYDRKLDMKVMHSGGFEEAADTREWEKWKVDQ